MSESLLIADCGATSGKWAFADRTSGSGVRFVTGPVNPSVYTDDEIALELAKAAQQCPRPPSAALMFAAGALGERAGRLRDMAAAAFGLDRRHVTVGSDLEGAAAALLGDTRGIACILGTGSNSCLWSGHAVEAHMHPMGYILGDEGSGAAIGAAVLRLAIRRLMPRDLMEEWDSAYPGLTYAALVNEVYVARRGSGYIASFVPFVAAHAAHPVIDTLVDSELRRFVAAIASAYPDAPSLPLAFTGGIAATFAPQLARAASAYGLGIATIAADPLALLVDRLCGRR